MIKNCFLNCLTLYGYMDPFPDLIVIYRFVSVCELVGHTVFQCNSGREYSNKLRGQSCKGPLNTTQHVSSIHIYRESQNIIDIWSDKHGKWKQRTLSTLTRMNRWRERAKEPERFVKYVLSWGLYGVCPCPTPIWDNLDSLATKYSPPQTR